MKVGYHRIDYAKPVSGINKNRSFAAKGTDLPCFIGDAFERANHGSAHSDNSPSAFPRLPYLVNQRLVNNSSNWGGVIQTTFKF